MLLHGADGDVELVRDLPVGQALRRKRGDLAFGVGEGGHRRCVRTAGLGAAEAGTPREKLFTQRYGLALLGETERPAGHHPNPYAWDELLSRDALFEGPPLLRGGVGLDVLHEEFARLFSFLPDLTGRVVSWADRAGVLFIEMEMTSARLGATAFGAVDRLHVEADGLTAARRTYLDPLPVVGAVTRRPGLWLRWWRSGVGPLMIRRHLTGWPGP